MGLRSDAPIGVFDSGLGGLTVAREIMRNLPDEKIVYFGDTARVPYGNRSRTTVVRYARQIVRFLLTEQIKAIVVACNTASAIAMDEIREEAGLPVLGVVEPGAKMAVEATKTKQIGVIATKATIDSDSYVRHIHEIAGDVTVRGRACPLLVPLVEEGWVHDDVTRTVLHRYLDELIEEGIDTLILGCTHYPLLRSEVQKMIGDQITLINPAYETAMALRDLLDREGLRNTTPKSKDDPTPYRFYVSDEAERFADFANSILPIDVNSAKLVPIEQY